MTAVATGTARAAQVTAAAGPKAVGTRAGMSEAKLGLLLVVPAMVLMAVVAGYPVIRAVMLSLYQYNVKLPNDVSFVGLSNYTRVLSSPHWWESMWTTTVFTVTSVSVEFTLGLAMALIMNRGIAGQGLIRAAVLVPWATITVITALAWKWLFTPDIGPIASLVAPIIGADNCLLCERYSAILSMAFADVWKTAPFIALLLLAGLQTIPGDMYEAADVDGASGWEKFRYITLPMLKPAILVAVLFRTLDAFRMFDLAYVMTGGANATESVSIMAYRRLMGNLDLGLGSAESVLIFICVLLIAVVFVKVLGTDPQAETT